MVFIEKILDTRLQIHENNFWIIQRKKILEPKDIKTRPLKDLTKESIFNIIHHSNKFRVNLKNANVLDLFSVWALLVLSVFKRCEKSDFC